MLPQLGQVYRSTSRIWDGFEAISDQWNSHVHQSRVIVSSVRGITTSRQLNYSPLFSKKLRVLRRNCFFLFMFYSLFQRNKIGKLRLNWKVLRGNFLVTTECGLKCNSCRFIWANTELYQTLNILSSLWCSVITDFSVDILSKVGCIFYKTFGACAAFLFFLP